MIKIVDLSRSLLKEFADLTIKSGDNNKPSNYVRGTVKVMSDKKYVQIDGSSTLTPISNVVDVDDNDRVLVSLENHTATIIGNFTFPPSARKEQEAIDSAEDAKDTAGDAYKKAESAIEKSELATTSAEEASRYSQEAVLSSDEAKEIANEAKENAKNAIDAANTANENANEAKKDASDSLAASNSAQGEVSRINGEVEKVKNDIDGALTDLESQASEIEGIKTNYSTKLETENVKADLSTEISTKIGELKTTIEEKYESKTDAINLEGRLQSQITQNAEGIKSQSSKIESLEADTAEAQKKVNSAIEAASEAQNNANSAIVAANDAKNKADNAQNSANDAQEKANKAAEDALKAREASVVADEALQSAMTDLREAEENFANISSKPDATAEEISIAKKAVDDARLIVEQALADAATAGAAAKSAQEAADKAQNDATIAQETADKAQNDATIAQNIANKAQEDAYKAQEDVAALTKRVTTAETSIEQNSEEIKLTASKTDEIGERISTVETNLSENYYNKTETDAAIQVSADEITSKVSETVVEIRDSADEANSKADYNGTRIDISETIIKQLSDSISMLVTDENGNSMMTQTSDGWTFNIGKINESINNAKDELNKISGEVNDVDHMIENLDSLIDDLAKKTAYIIMSVDETGAPCIELGKEDNPFKVRITNSSVDFMEGTIKIAYISNKALYIERAIIKDELQIGEGTGFIWKRRSNGNMGLRWTGGNN